MLEVHGGGKGSARKRFLKILCRGVIFKTKTRVRTASRLLERCCRPLIANPRTGDPVQQLKICEFPAPEQACENPFSRKSLIAK